MKRVMVRYKVKPDQAAANEELVRAVYEELNRTKPDGLRYATFQLWAPASDFTRESSSAMRARQDASSSS